MHNGQKEQYEITKNTWKIPLAKQQVVPKPDLVKKGNGSQLKGPLYQKQNISGKKFFFFPPLEGGNPQNKDSQKRLHNRLPVEHNTAQQTDLL